MPSPDHRQIQTRHRPGVIVSRPMNLRRPRWRRKSLSLSYVSYYRLTLSYMTQPHSSTVPEALRAGQTTRRRENKGRQSSIGCGLPLRSELPAFGLGLLRLAFRLRRLASTPVLRFGGFQRRGDPPLRFGASRLRSAPGRPGAEIHQNSAPSFRPNVFSSRPNVSGSRPNASSSSLRVAQPNSSFKAHSNSSLEPTPIALWSPLQ